MTTHNFSCRESDIRRIRITCRCGHRFITEVPDQLAAGRMLSPCQQCGRLFEVHRNPLREWKVRPLGANVQDMAYCDASPPEQSVEQLSWAVGLRVKIVDGSKTSSHFNNPHPELIGKLGYISKAVNIEGHMSPLITLDNGQEIGGWECWWEPYATGGGN